MKRIILFLLLSLGTVSAWASLRQSEYRWRNDDGDEISATWKAAPNTAIFLTDFSTILRVRIEFDNENSLGEISTIGHYLYYSKDGGGTWTQINNSETNDFKLVNSAHVSHGESTTAHLSAGFGTFTSGKIVSDITPSAAVTISDGQKTEMEWVIQPTIFCENFTTYLFEMTEVESSGVRPELNTDFDCDEPVITVDSFYERCNPGRFEINASVDIEEATINWWDAEVDGDLLGSGPIFTTDSYLTSTTIYAEGFSGGCFAERIPVELIIRPSPDFQIDLTDGVYCANNGILNITSSPEQPESSVYLWNTGESTSNINVPPSFGVEKTYWLQITNEWGCVNTDTGKYIINPSPEVDLGPDVTVCEGSSVTLDAANPDCSFYWNTGALTQTLTVDDGGEYHVIATNEFGCYAMDTIMVTVEGFSPTTEGIIVYNMGPMSYKFKAHNPLNVEGYKWNFGDSSAVSVSPSPTHTYANPGTYYVTLEISSSCGKAEYHTYATVVQSIEEAELAKKYLKVYPNPAQNTLLVETTEGVMIEQIEVINNLGQKTIQQAYGQSSRIQLELGELPSGIYYLNVISDKGLMIQKFQILK